MCGNDFFYFICPTFSSKGKLYKGHLYYHAVVNPTECSQVN